MDKPIQSFILDNNSNIDNILLQKMIFLYNSLEDGWSIKRDKKSYILTKKHENKKEIYKDSYLSNVVTSNMSLKNK
jgi:hypothetical protein